VTFNAVGDKIRAGHHQGIGDLFMYKRDMQAQLDKLMDSVLKRTVECGKLNRLSPGKQNYPYFCVFGINKRGYHGGQIENFVTNNESLV
jgi:hypothetical protein